LTKLRNTRLHSSTFDARNKHAMAMICRRTQSMALTPTTRTTTRKLEQPVERVESIPAHRTRTAIWFGRIDGRVPWLLPYTLAAYRGILNEVGTVDALFTFDLTRDAAHARPGTIELLVGPVVQPTATLEIHATTKTTTTTTTRRAKRKAKAKSTVKPCMAIALGAYYHNVAVLSKPVIG
jgi:hypothetical protein